MIVAVAFEGAAFMHDDRRIHWRKWSEVHATSVRVMPDHTIQPAGEVIP